MTGDGVGERRDIFGVQILGYLCRVRRTRLYLSKEQAGWIGMIFSNFLADIGITAAKVVVFTNFMYVFYNPLDGMANANTDKDSRPYGQGSHETTRCYARAKFVWGF